WIRLERRRTIRRRALQYAFEMIVDRNRERLLRDVLSDHILVERTADIRRLRHPNGRRLPASVFVQFLVENAFADVDATVADVNAGTGDEFTHLRVAFATERAHGEVGSARHIRWLKEQLLFLHFARQGGLCDRRRRVGTGPVEELHFLP